MLSKYSFRIVVFLIVSTYASNSLAAEFCSLAQSALQKNQNLISLNFQLDASKQRIFQSQNSNGPKLRLLANLSVYTAQQGGTKLNKDGTVSMAFSQTLYDSGLGKALEQSAISRDRLLQLDMVANTQKTIVEMATLYVQYLQNKQLLSLHHINLATANSQYQISEEKFAVSEATQQELMLVKSRVRQAMSEMLRAKSQVMINRVKILGLANNSPTGNGQKFLNSLLSNVPKNISKAVSLAQTNSIEIDQSGVAIDIANSDVLAQNATLGPTLQINAQVGYGRVGTNQGLAGQIGLSFSMPLYSSGVLESKVREAKAMLASARARHAYTVELSKQSVSASFEVIKNIKQSVAILPEAIRAEQAAINSLEQSLASSFIPIADILIVKNSLFELRKTLINLKFERYLAHLYLLNSIGQFRSINALSQTGLCQ